MAENKKEQSSFRFRTRGFDQRKPHGSETEHKNVPKNKKKRKGI